MVGVRTGLMWDRIECNRASSSEEETLVSLKDGYFLSS
jgi:hypothetical protein